MTLHAASAPAAPPERWVTARDFSALGLDLRRPSVDIGGPRSRDGAVTLAFSPEESGNHGFVFARRPDVGRYLLVEADTTRQAVDAARFAVGGEMTRPDGYQAIAAEISRQPEFTARDAHRFWLDSVEAEFAVLKVFEDTLHSSEQWRDLALGCLLAESIRSTAEWTYIQALRGLHREPVIVDFSLRGRPDWRARLPVPSLRALRLDVGYLHDLAGQYGLAVFAEPSVASHGSRRFTPYVGVGVEL